MRIYSNGKYENKQSEQPEWFVLGENFSIQMDTSCFFTRVVCNSSPLQAGRGGNRATFLLVLAAHRGTNVFTALFQLIHTWELEKSKNNPIKFCPAISFLFTIVFPLNFHAFLLVRSISAVVFSIFGIKFHLNPSKLLLITMKTSLHALLHHFHLPSLPQAGTSAASQLLFILFSMQ